MTTHNTIGNRIPSLASALVIVLAAASAHPAHAQTPDVSFSKSFGPDTIGPGSISTLTLMIESGESQPVTDLAFSDTLPAAMIIATPTGAGTDCGAGAVLSAPAGGGTITLSDGSLPAADGGTVSCQVTVNVTSDTAGVHTNISGDLTSSLGSHGSATADLTVDADRPGFTKSFAPDTILAGQTATLTFTIDNSASSSNHSALDIVDELPPGLVVADPANAVNDCNLAISADPGSDTINAAGDVLAGATCNASVDVTASIAGSLENTSEELTSFDVPISGKAGAVLESQIQSLVKRFTDDPAAPGDTATLEFEITNFNRDVDLTDIEFSDDLDAALTGMTATGLPRNDICGTGSTIDGTGTLTFSGGRLAPEERCIFEVTLQVPAGAAPGDYINTTSTVSGNAGSEPVTGAAASDTLTVAAFPLLTKEFIDDPAAPGGEVTLEFTLTNTSAADGATDITFSDDLNAAVAGMTAAGLPQSDICGAGSQLNEAGGVLTLAGGVLGPGDSCTFQVTLNLPADAPGGLHTNTTGSVEATVDGDSLTGPPASDDLEIVDSPRLTKAFTDGPTVPGDTVTLQFTLQRDAESVGEVTNIAFSDDLDATLAGLTSVSGTLTDVCGAGSQLSGTSILDFTGGNLSAGESCSFDVTLQVPASAPFGEFVNVTSQVTATVDGVAATSPAANDTLSVSALRLGKTFTDDPVIPGGSANLRFTIENLSGSSDAADIAFSDDLDAALAGMTATGLPSDGFCGAASQITGTSVLNITGANLLADSSCTFDIPVAIPAGADSDTYLNVTSDGTATVGGSPSSFAGASGTLAVNASLLQLEKEFTDDPVNPGGLATLEFTLANFSDSDTVTAITFSDDLDAALTGLASESGTLADVCGAGSELSGTSELTLTDGTLDPLASCTFSIAVRLPDTISGDGSATNVTSAASGTVGGLAVDGSAASDELQIRHAAFTKAFASPGAATGSVDLVFTIDNFSSTDPLSALTFTDDLDAVVAGLTAVDTPKADVCGEGSEISGTSVLTLTEGSVPPEGSCTFEITLAIPGSAPPGSFANTSSELFSGGLVVATPATANLSIQPPPSFAKVFNPNAVTVGGLSTLTFTIDNTASTLAADSLEFSDALPAGLVVASTPEIGNTCGGSVTAVAGSGIIALSGGSVPAGADCTLTVDVTGTAEGSFTNTTGALTSSSGDSGTASDDLDVVSGDFVVTKNFRTAPVLPGGLVEMELSIVNGSAFPLSSIELSDDLDAAIPGLAGESLPLDDVCGPGSQLSGTGVVSLIDGALAPGGSCTVVVPVRVPVDAPEGAFVNTTSMATGEREGVSVDAPAASAEVSIESLQFDKHIAPDIVAADSTTTLTFSISNPDPANGVDSLAFSDDLEAFVPGMTAANTPINDACGTGSVLDGDSPLALSDGQLPAGGSCTVEVTLNVPAGAEAGDYTNITSALSGLVDGNAIGVDAVEAGISIQPAPGFSKVFSPGHITTGETATLTFVIDNSGSELDADTLAFNDPLPTGMSIAPDPAIANDCGGTLAGSAGDGAVQLSDGGLAAGDTCQITIDVAVDAADLYTNTSGDLTSGLGNSGAATDELLVTAAPAFSKAFDPGVIEANQTSTLTLVIDNGANPADADDLAFVDNLPTALQLADDPTVSNTCGGAVEALAGGGSIELSGGSVAAGAQCSISVAVTGDQPGTHTNTSNDLTSSLGNSGPASADLVIDEDSDGVPANVEDGAPNGGDGNGDGIPDRIQDRVASLPTFNGTSFMTLVVSGACDELNNVAAVNPGTREQAAPENIAFPLGLVGFELPCESASVDITFHDAGPMNGFGYWKFGPTTPGDPASAGWYDFSEIGASREDNVWRLDLADNSPGDATGDDGVIVDPGGPGGDLFRVPLFTPHGLLVLAALMLLAAFASRKRLLTNQ